MVTAIALAGSWKRPIPAPGGAKGAQGEMRRGQRRRFTNPDDGQAEELLPGLGPVLVLYEDRDVEPSDVLDDVDDLGGKQASAQDRELLPFHFGQLSSETAILTPLGR